ncbi:MAG: DNA methyltransferase [Rhodospirillaceae bacterium BRH_c57]|nr:MAG: DNA methyltransferase [Rhodospirillaceae bacterium BRH_c57]
MTTAIDLFAGLGGFTEGASLAGVRVLWAANHAPAAVATHAANHPDTAHVCQDLHQADWTQVPAHDILLASPCCQGHARARGKDRPHHDASRSTAWAVVSAAECHRPPVCIVENVPEFQAWALYPAWADAMARLGYTLAPHTIDAADHGVPQHRIRLLIIATRSRAPLRLTLDPLPHRPAREIIRWDDYAWSPIDRPGRSAATLARIKRARRDLGTDVFLTPYYGSGSGLTGRSLDRPLGTVTTLDRWAIIRGDHMRMLQPTELRAAMGFRDSYILAPTRRTAIHQLGNAVCPPKVARVVAAIQAAA